MLPIYVMWDSGLSNFEQDCVRGAMIQFKTMFPGRDIKVYGSRQWSLGDYCSANWYIKEAKSAKGFNGLQLDASYLLDLMEKEPWQKATPHVDALVTSYDLTAEGLNFCFGMTRGRFTVQSVARYGGLKLADRRIAINMVIWHELGHVFGLASDMGRDNTEYKLGPHCTSDGCVMRQGMNLEEFLQYARDAERMGRIYCPLCMRDMCKTRI